MQRGRDCGETPHTFNRHVPFRVYLVHPEVRSMGKAFRMYLLHPGASERRACEKEEREKERVSESENERREDSRESAREARE